MSAFPTLSRQPQVGGLREAAQDDVLSHECEAGPDVTRTSVTRPYTEFVAQWMALSAADIILVRAWWTSYRATFTDWTHPDTTVWSVRPKGPPAIANAQALGLYDMSLVLRGYLKP